MNESGQPPEQESFDISKEKECQVENISTSLEAIPNTNGDYIDTIEAISPVKSDSSDDKFLTDFEIVQTTETEAKEVMADARSPKLECSAEESLCQQTITKSYPSSEASDINILGTEDIMICEESSKAPLSDDDYFYQQLDIEELTFYNNHKAKQEFRCLVCSKQVSSANLLFRHPYLGISTCSKCCDFLLRDGWTKDDAGFDQQCRWCGQGGNILLCDNCPSSLCEGCLSKNLGRKYLRDAQTTDNWKCLMCDYSPILELRADHYAVYKIQQAKMSRKKTGQAKSQREGGTGSRVDKEVALKLLDGIFGTDIYDTLDKLSCAFKMEKNCCYNNIDTLNIEDLKTMAINVAQIFSKFEGFFKSERIRIGYILEGFFYNYKEVDGDYQESKVRINKPKSLSKRNVPQTKVCQKNSMPVTVKSKKKVQNVDSNLRSKRQVPKTKQPIQTQGQTSRKRTASPVKTHLPTKGAKITVNGKKSKSSPKEIPSSITRESRLEARINRSNSSSPTKSNVTPTKMKAFPDTQASGPLPIIPSISGLSSQISTSANKSSENLDSHLSKPKIGPKSKVQKIDEDEDNAREVFPKKKIGPRSRVCNDTFEASFLF